MDTNTFNPLEWLDKKEKKKNEQPVLNTNSTQNFYNDIEKNVDFVVSRIEENRTDITDTYENWLTCAFALADGLGENGRSFFHRLCAFYAGYDFDECDRKFSMALRDHGHGITINSFFHLAKSKGVDISHASVYKQQQNPTFANRRPQQNFQQNQKIETNSTQSINSTFSQQPHFEESIFSHLPRFLSDICLNASTQDERDLFLIGSISTLSSCLSNVSGIYGGVTVFPNLFLYVTALASAGKGRLNLCRRLVEPIHNKLREINKLEVEDYNKKLRDFKKNAKDEEKEAPQEPPIRMLFIPANSSATALFQILGSNESVGLLFETEGDTLANTFKSEHGNYSDGLRKAFHHEKISYLRRKDKEYVSIDCPKLSAVLSGTPKQICSLIPDAENGLFSRFIFFCLNMSLTWLDVFANDDKKQSLDMIFNSLGEQFFEFYSYFHVAGSFNFSLSDDQKQKFNDYFSETQFDFFDTLGEDYIGSVRRLGLITFRIMMILSTLRIMETGDIDNQLYCNDDDFNTAILMSKTLIQHSATVFNMLPETDTKLNANTKDKHILLDTLNETFSRKDYTEKAEALGFSQRSADRLMKQYIDKNLVLKENHSTYKKVSPIC